MIVAAFDYDATDQPPLNKQVLSGYDGAVRGNVWNKLNANCKPMGGWYYCGTPTATTSNPVGTDLKMYDLGKFYLGVYNQASATPVGELVVDYEVEFSKPDTSVLSALSERWTSTGSAISNLPGTLAVDGNNVFAITSGGSGVLNMTAQTSGDYMITFTMTVTGNNSTIFVSQLQYEPNASTSTAIYMLEGVSNFVSAGASYTALLVYAVSVVPGTVLAFTLASTVTVAAITRGRISSYKRALL
jgi:hypothetical protein